MRSPSLPMAAPELEISGPTISGVRFPSTASHSRRLAGLVPLLLLLFAAQADAREAYVGNGGSSSVSVIETATNQTVGPQIPVGLGPFGAAITPDGGRVYVTNIDVGTVRAIDPGTKQVLGPPIEVGGGPFGTAITPDGRRAYIATGGAGAVAVIDTATDFVGPPIPVGTDPEGIAITPDGSRAYVSNWGSGDVWVIDLASGQPAVPPIPIGTHPRGIAITPDGTRVYVTDLSTASVTSIDTATNQVLGSPIPVGEEPSAVAITPDGSRAYVANAASDSVTAIDTAANQPIGPPIAVGKGPKGIAITPDGSRAYVTNSGAGSVSVIDTVANLAVGPAIPVGTAPIAVAITPDQAPRASFTVPAAGARPGVPVAFDASASSDADGSIARYAWNFGDGRTLADGGPGPSPVYAAPGTYPVSLTVTDEEGCSTALVYTGQTAFCNGSALATATGSVTVAFPAVRVHCPKRARRGGCSFKLQAVTRKPTRKRKSKPTTRPARVRIKPGRKKLVTLRPKARFRSGFSVGRKVVVRVTLKIKGERKRVGYRRLKLVR